MFNEYRTLGRRPPRQCVGMPPAPAPGAPPGEMSDLRHHVDVHRQIGFNFKMDGGTGARVKQVSGGQGARGHGVQQVSGVQGHGDTPPQHRTRSRFASSAGAEQHFLGGRNRGVVHSDEHGAPHPPVDNFSGLTTPLRVGDPQVWIFTFPSPL